MSEKTGQFLILNRNLAYQKKKKAERWLFYVGYNFCTLKDSMTVKYTECGLRHRYKYHEIIVMVKLESLDYKISLSHISTIGFIYWPFI